jgi:hypothetical protein
MEKNKCRTKGQKSCGPTKEIKTCSWFDKNDEKYNGSIKGLEKQIKNNNFCTIDYVYSIGE